MKEKFENRTLTGSIKIKMDDAKCPILTQTMVVSVQDAQYPTEWIYDEHDKPTCTAFSLHIWHDVDGNIIEPEEVTNDPDQLDLFN